MLQNEASNNFSSTQIADHKKNIELNLSFNYLIWNQLKNLSEKYKNFVHFITLSIRLGADLIKLFWNNFTNTFL